MLHPFLFPLFLSLSPTIICWSRPSAHRCGASCPARRNPAPSLPSRCSLPPLDLCPTHARIEVGIVFSRYASKLPPHGLATGSQRYRSPLSRPTPLDQDTTDSIPLTQSHQILIKWPRFDPTRVHPKGALSFLEINPRSFSKRGS